MVNSTQPFPSPTIISKPVPSMSTNHSGNITGATKTGGKKTTQYGGVTYTGPAVQTSYTSRAGVNPQQTATALATTTATANAQASNDGPGLATYAKTTPVAVASGGGRRKSKKSKKSKKSRKSRKSRKHKRRNIYKK